jgi:lipopolysaccharide transport system ATP-binding protein
MSSDIVIRAEGLGKKYTIGHQSAERVPTLRDAISRGAGGLLRGAGEMLRGRAIIAGDETEEFWALKNVNFEVARGEVLGIIGRNGAGKSTLLKVLSRITEPTEGRVEIRGRVASLLEVGTGFHPELSGRENIFLNGAILGMSRREIKAKFDEIVDFAEVERFLDTPVKRYSSGMYVRLAFAVAAHLEPEILVVDEVLAVGDAEFQKKCLGKMQDVASGGRTVLFVSHNMGAIESLCPRAILLSRGQMVADGNSSDVILDYFDRWRIGSQGKVTLRQLEPGLSFESLRPSQDIVRSGDPCQIELTFIASKPGAITGCQVLIYSATGVRIAAIDVREFGILPYRYDLGRFIIRVDVKSLPFVEGHYSLGVALGSTQHGATHEDLYDLQIVSELATKTVRYPANVRGFFELAATAEIFRDVTPI